MKSRSTWKIYYEPSKISFIPRVRLIWQYPEIQVGARVTPLSSRLYLLYVKKHLSIRLISNNLKREYKSIPPHPRNQVLNILVLALMAVALAVGDWLTITQHNPLYFIASVIVSLVIFIAVRRYVSRRM